MNVEDIFDQMINSGFAKKVKRKKVNYLSEFYGSQLYKGINDDKNGLKHLIHAEKQVEKSSKHFVGKKMSHPFGEYSVTSYFVNFQYFVELINVHGRKMGLLKDMRVYANNGCRSVAGLLIVLNYYYLVEISGESDVSKLKDILHDLGNKGYKTNVFSFSENYYYSSLVV